MTLEVWAYTQGEGTWPTSFGSWWTLCKCRLGLRLWATKGFQVRRILYHIETKDVHIFFRDFLSWTFSFLTTPISPMTIHALWLGYLLSKNRGFDQTGF
jgi:hypothetical protein